MKTVIFFLFSFISYVFAGAVGPLGLAAQMPPYRPFVGGFQLKSDLISGSYSLEEALLFLSGGSGQNCEKHLQDACEDLKRAYDDSSLDFGFVLSIVCDYKHEACTKMTEVEQKLCNVADVTYEDVIRRGPLNSDICADLYTKCRLRSSGCSAEYTRQCQRLISMCQNDYDLFDIFNIFLEGVGSDVASPTFIERLGELCRSLFNVSDTLIQRCLDPGSLKRDLMNFIKFQEQGQGGFFLFPEVSAGALLKAQRLDGGLFSPRTRLGTDPVYLLGYLLGLFSHTSFMKICTVVSQACFGLGFFPQTAHFCDINSYQALSTNCQQAEITLMEQDIPKIRDHLASRLWKGEYHGAPVTGGVDSDLCKEYLIDCSYLKRLDSDLSYLCDFLKDYCSYSLEIASSLSIFEYFFREQNKEKNPGHKLDTCEKDLRETCLSRSNSSVDFLLFCYRPGHTCTALKELTRLRCEGYKKKFDVDAPTERYCLGVAFEYEPYMHWCPQSESSVTFFTKCSTEFPENEYLKNLFATTLKELVKPEDDAKAKVDDGF